MKVAVEPKRIYEPIALGVVANVLVTYLLKPLRPSFEWSDFVVACILLVPVTEFSRYLDHRLERKYPWQHKPFKRILLHFIYLAIMLAITLNVLGNIYMLASGQSFFTGPELLLIHSATFLVALLLTFFNWTLHFYGEWRNTSVRLQDSSLEIRNLRQDMARADQAAEFQKGNQKIRIELKTVRLARIEAGVVRVFLEDSQGIIFPGTLRELAEQLPAHLFFPVTRDVIVHRDLIQSISSGSYGKIAVDVKTSSGAARLVVSRLKASAFRKWYHSIST